MTGWRIRGSEKFSSTPKCFHAARGMRRARDVGRTGDTLYIRANDGIRWCPVIVPDVNGSATGSIHCHAVTTPPIVAHAARLERIP